MRGGRRPRARARGRGGQLQTCTPSPEVCGDTLKPYRCREYIYLVFTTPSTREVAYERQEIDNAATVSRGTLRPVIYLGRECAASVTSYPPPVWTDVASCNIIQYRVVTETFAHPLV